MRAVNLLPREAAKQRKTLAAQKPALVGAGCGVFIMGALALGFMHESGSVSSTQKELEQAKQELANTPRPVKVTQAVDPNAQLAGEKSARITAVSTVVGARIGWDRILREFSLVLPDDVSLTSLTLQTPQASPTAAVVTGVPAVAPVSLTIVGDTYSHDSVARLLARLSLIPELTDVTLSSDASSAATGAEDSGGPNLISFTITAALKVDPAASSLTAPPVVVAPPPTTTDTGSSS
jgi:Tfp pilus assembly protein PilN